MLAKFERVKVSNDGNERVFSLEPIFINVDRIITVSDTDKMSEVLKLENSCLHERQFSVLTWAEGPSVKESIVIGTAESIFEALSTANASERGLLNG